MSSRSAAVCAYTQQVGAAPASTLQVRVSDLDSQIWPQNLHTLDWCAAELPSLRGTGLLCALLVNFGGANRRINPHAGVRLCQTPTFCC